MPCNCISRIKSKQKCGSINVSREHLRDVLGHFRRALLQSAPIPAMTAVEGRPTPRPRRDPRRGCGGRGRSASGAPGQALLCEAFLGRQ